MQKTVLWGIVGALCIGIGVTAYLMKDRETATTIEGNVTEEVAESADEVSASEEETFSGMGTLKALFGRGESFQCTYSYTDPEYGNGEGTSYFDGERMRAEGTYAKDGIVFETHMINDGVKLYSWSLSPEGTYAFVMDLETDETEEEYAGSELEQSTEDDAALNETVEYECKKWRPENSVFVPPSDIAFVDMEALMNASLESFTLPQE